MSSDQPNEMSVDDRDEFLGTGGTGVLSLSAPADEPPHAVPVSYGYDATDGAFYFRLAVRPDSEKGDLADRPVTFVTYGESGDGWRSVVASGRLAATTEESIAIESLEGLERVDLQYVDIFGQPLRTVTFEFYRLTPDEIGARQESSSGT